MAADRRRAVAVAALLALAAGCSGPSGKAMPVASNPSLPPTGAALQRDAPLPVDPDVRTGTLANGLTYYVRENDDPGGSAELRLAVDAGSVLEDDDQGGVAHFLEHMLFNGTAAYPGNELTDVLRGFGMELGADVNASTSFDETVYQLTVPTDDGGADLRTALDVLEQWLAEATIADDDVSDERGVVLDEWRESEQSQGGRVFDAIERLFLTGTAYEGRDPIGTRSAIESMTAAPLRRFYTDWYRPDLAAVVVVGDVDADEVVAGIAEALGGVPPRPGRDRPAPTVVPSQVPEAEVVADPDTTDPFVELTLPAPAQPMGTYGAVADQVVDGLVVQMIADRLADDARAGGSVLTDAWVDSNSHVRPLDAPSVMVAAPGADLREAASLLVAELERARRFGFGEREVARAVEDARAQLDAAYERRASLQDAELADAYVDHFLRGAPISSPDDQRSIGEQVLDGVTPDVVLDRFLVRTAAGAPHLLLVGGADDDLPSADELVAMVQDAGTLDLAPRPDAAAAATTLMERPPAVEPLRTEQLDAAPWVYLRPTQLTFANGLRVVLNPTPIAEGRVSLEARSRGGSSLVDPADASDALLAPEVVAAGGLGDLDAVELGRFVAGVDAVVQPYLSPAGEGIYGDAAASELETLLQLVHLTMTAPVVDQAAVDRVVASHPDADAALANDPDLALQAELLRLRYGDEDPRVRIAPTAADLEALDVDGVRRVWADRFGDAGDWVVAIAGDVDLDEATRLASAYLGTLPGAPHEETPLPIGSATTGPLRSTVRSGTGDRAQLAIEWDVPVTTVTGRDEATATVLAGLLTQRLTDVVREQLGASYSPFAFTDVTTDSTAQLSTIVLVTGAPDRMAEIAPLVEDIVDSFRRGEIGADELAGAIEIARRDAQLIANEQIDDEILDELVDGATTSTAMGRAPDDIGRVTLAAVQAHARRFLPADGALEVTVLPG